MIYFFVVVMVIFMMLLISCDMNDMLLCLFSVCRLKIFVVRLFYSLYRLCSGYMFSILLIFYLFWVWVNIYMKIVFVMLLVISVFSGCIRFEFVYIVIRLVSGLL